MNREDHCGPAPDAQGLTNYEIMTDRLLKVSGDLRMVHYGLWGPDTETERDSLMRSMHTLAGGCGLGPDKRVLDAGCGLGGPAVALAQEFGAHVTGLTIVEPHVALATDFAQQRGVGHLVEFRHGDFMDMLFPDASFDMVTNQETYYYAPDGLAYLRGALRVLKPGGHLRMLEATLSGKPMTGAQEAVHASLQRGFRMLRPLSSLSELLATVEQAGFERICERNLDTEVAPAAESLSKRWKLFVLLTPPPRPDEIVYHEFMQAAVDFDQGLQEGFFAYNLISAAKPG